MSSLDEAITLLVDLTLLKKAASEAQKTNSKRKEVYEKMEDLYDTMIKGTKKSIRTFAKLETNEITNNKDKP